MEDATQIALAAAQARGIPAWVVEYLSAQELRENSPSPYGVYGIVLDGRLLSYYYLSEKGFANLGAKDE